MLAGTAARAQTAEQAWLKYTAGHANAGIRKMCAHWAAAFWKNPQLRS